MLMVCVPDRPRYKKRATLKIVTSPVRRGKGGSALCAGQRLGSFCNMSDRCACLVAPRTFSPFAVYTGAGEGSTGASWRGMLT